MFNIYFNEFQFHKGAIKTHEFGAHARLAPVSIP